MANLFLTGASGFVGRRFLQTLDPRAFDAIRILARADLVVPERLAPMATVIRGDLTDASTYAREMDRGTIALHLAALTGSAPPSEFREINVRGTEALLNASETAGVERLIFVSSIAAGFPNLDRYPYGASKRDAEKLIETAAIPWTILRPTIVLGRDSPTWKKLSGLAGGPVTIVPGSGEARIQPIHLDDLCATLEWAVTRPAPPGVTLEIGGPEAVTMEDFLRRIARRLRGADTRPVHVPLRPLLPLLRLGERVISSAMPIRAGQLSAFVHDSVVRRPAESESDLPDARGVDALLDSLTASNGEPNGAG